MTQHGTMPQGGQYHQSSGVTSQNANTPTISLPQQLPSEAPETVKLADGREVRVTPYEEDSAVTSFTRSQLQRMKPAEYNTLKDKIQAAQELGLIIDDLTIPEQRERQDAALRASSAKIQAAIKLRDARAATNTTLKAWQDAQGALEIAKRSGDSYEISAAEQRLADTNSAFSKANAALKKLENPEAPSE